MTARKLSRRAFLAGAAAAAAGGYLTYRLTRAPSVSRIRYRLRRRGGAWTKPLSKTDVLAVLRERASKHPAPYRLRRWCEGCGWGRPRELAGILDRLREVLPKVHVGATYSVRAADGVTWDLRKVEIDLTCTSDTQGTPAIDRIYCTVARFFDGVESWGICACRRVRGGTAWSQHCLTGDTPVITPDGWTPIGKLAQEGRAVVLTRDPFAQGSRGTWQLVPVRSYGEQEVYAVRLSLWGREQVIRATPQHRWFIRRGERGRDRICEVTTIELQPGDRPLTVWPRHLTNVEPSPYGIAAGLVFGDGHLESGSSSGAAITLWGEKAQLERVFPEGCTRTRRVLPTGVEGIAIRGLPRSFKRRPSLAESTAYLAGWLAGYIAADGHVANGQLTLSCRDRDTLEFVRVVAARLGIATREPRAERSAGYRPGVQWTLGFVGATVPDWLILRHEPVRGERMAHWTVKEVQPAGSEEVFCATVPGTGAFAVSEWILTGNSYCNAWDIHHDDPVVMRRVADFLVANAYQLDVATVIYDRRIWTRDGGWRTYTGVDPHTDHVHVEGYPLKTGTPPCAL